MAKDSQCSSSLMFALIPDFPFRDDLRSIIDYPKDIMELADSLSLDKFCIFGFSGGAPYALACAWKICYLY
jgi:pimeloyl-ACP methyl ester carboxylesterase